MDTIETIWTQLRSTQSPPDLWVALSTLLTAVALVAPPRVWHYTRNVVTISHEGGHAIVAFCVGRRLAGIRLHSDTSGVTVSAGKPTGLGMVLTAFAGYTAPALMGLGAAALLAQGRVLATLWVATILLAVMLLLIRNLYGAFTVALTGAGLFAVSWWSPDLVQTVVATLLVWFLVVAAPRPVWELHHKRRSGEADDSDADQLARLTAVPGIVWVVIFALVTLACGAYTAQLLTR